MENIWVSLVKKIELQSIIVLTITLLAGYFLLKLDNSFTKPAGILGCISIGTGLIYTLISFSTNLLKEEYQNIINHYEKTIDTLRTTSNTALDLTERAGTFAATIRDQDTSIGGYQPIKSDSAVTQKSRS